MCTLQHSISTYFIFTGLESPHGRRVTLEIAKTRSQLFVTFPIITIYAMTSDSKITDMLMLYGK